MFFIYYNISQPDRLYALDDLILICKMLFVRKFHLKRQLKILYNEHKIHGNQRSELIIFYHSNEKFILIPKILAFDRPHFKK